MAQCLECGEEYPPISKALAGSGDLLLNQFQEDRKDIFIGMTDGIAG